MSMLRAALVAVVVVTSSLPAAALTDDLAELWARVHRYMYPPKQDVHPAPSIDVLTIDVPTIVHAPPIVVPAPPVVTTTPTPIPRVDPRVEPKPRPIAKPTPKPVPKPTAPPRVDNSGPDLPYACALVRFSACGKSEADLADLGRQHNVKLTPKQERQARACLAACPKPRKPKRTI